MCKDFTQAVSLISYEEDYLVDTVITTETPERGVAILRDIIDTSSLLSPFALFPK